MIRKIESIEELNRFFGQRTYHPQVSVCNLPMQMLRSSNLLNMACIVWC